MKPPISHSDKSYYNPKTSIAISLLDHVCHAAPCPGPDLETPKPAGSRPKNTAAGASLDLKGYKRGISTGFLVYEWDVNGIWMGCEWYTNGIRIGYEWDFNGISMVVNHQSMDWWTKHTKLLGLCFKHGGVPHERCWFIFRGVKPNQPIVVAQYLDPGSGCLTVGFWVFPWFLLFYKSEANVPKKNTMKTKLVGSDFVFFLQPAGHTARTRTSHWRGGSGN